MSSQSSRQGGADDATGHPLRVEILGLAARLRTSSMSPREVRVRLNSVPRPGGPVSLRTVSYHASVLARAGLLEREGFDRRRGIPFRVTPAGLLALAAVAKAPSGE